MRNPKNKNHHFIHFFDALGEEFDKAAIAFQQNVFDGFIFQLYRTYCHNVAFVQNINSKSGFGDAGCGRVQEPTRQYIVLLEAVQLHVGFAFQLFGQRFYNNRRIHVLNFYVLRPNNRFPISHKAVFLEDLSVG